MKTHGRSLVALLLGLMIINCQSRDSRPAPSPPATSFTTDAHSYANPSQIRVKHLDLEAEVLFDRRVLKGVAALELERAGGAPAASLILDTRRLQIIGVESSPDGKLYSSAPFKLGAEEAILGAPLTIELPSGARWARVTYETSPEATGLQWLGPPQTAGKQQPFLFTQSQAIHARSWIPLQDTPQVRLTYRARIRTPTEVRAVMSAENDPRAPRNGDYRFEMKQSIPSYLIALAVGELEFREMGPRTGVYAEPSVVGGAAREFADTERMIEATERLYGPYRWDRYDLLVLPPSFPIGGMENPRLTFATPTVIAGDKSLVSLVAHELAHSWSGNLVTNATWRDFWLNEGFTTYLERRIVEAIYGRAREEMEASLGRQDLQREIDSLPDRDEILYVDLAGRDPDDGFTQVPYEKGALFLRHLEETFGRERFDQFLRGYFDHFAFRSVSTDEFLKYLQANLLASDTALAAKVPVEQWVYRPGVPESAPRPSSDAFARVEAQAAAFATGQTPAAALSTANWTTHEWLHFLRRLPPELSREQLTQLDRAFRLTDSGNAEIAHQWLLLAIRHRYAPANSRLEQYLITIGRRKLIKPLYEELVKTPEGSATAARIYRLARPGYHPITQAAIDEVVKARAS